MALTETRLDKIIGIGSGVGSRPAAGQTGARWIDTTGPTESYDNGTAWATLTSGAAGALTKISEQILGATATSVTFSSIAASYRHLQLTAVARGDTVANNIGVTMQLNGDTAGNYDYQLLQVYVTTVSAGGFSGQSSGNTGIIAAASAASGAPGYLDIIIYDYARTTFRKIYKSDNLCDGVDGGGSNFQEQNFRGVWKSTAAVTSIVLNIAAGNFIVGSVFSLYGIS